MLEDLYFLSCARSSRFRAASSERRQRLQQAPVRCRSSWYQTVLPQTGHPCRQRQNAGLHSPQSRTASSITSPKTVRFAVGIVPRQASSSAPNGCPHFAHEAPSSRDFAINRYSGVCSISLDRSKDLRRISVQPSVTGGRPGCSCPGRVSVTHRILAPAATTPRNARTCHSLTRSPSPRGAEAHEYRRGDLSQRPSAPSGQKCPGLRRHGTRPDNPAQHAGSGHSTRAPVGQGRTP